MQQYDFIRIQSLLKDFYNLTNIKICLYDNSGKELCFFPEKFTPFCAEIRKDKEMEKLCLECDKKAMLECKKTRKACTHVCHAGLIECFSPILHGDTIIGYIVLGQIRVDKTKPNFSESLNALYENLPIIAKDKIDSAINVLNACTSYEYLKKIDLYQKPIEDKILEFINENIKNDLSVQTLCDKFRLTRVEIYEIFKNSFNSTVADFVKKCRLEKASELLKETSYSVNLIADKIGVPDYNYFSKIFKVAYGISPREFRKKEKGKF